VKKDERGLLPADTVDPALLRIFTEGIPASVDSDPTDDRMLAGLLSSFDFEMSVRFAKRAGLFREWLALPNVTLSQGAWLLLGRNPFEPNAVDPELPPQDLERQHREIVNRLECEVIAGKLTPVGRAVEGFERRFGLLAIAKAAALLRISRNVTAHLLMLSSHVESSEQAREPSGQAWQTDRVQERMAIHNRLIESIRTQHPNLVQPLVPKKKRSRVRRADVTPLNLHIDMAVAEYEVAFLEAFKSTYGGIPPYHVSRFMLHEDREQLNVKFKRGRRREPPQSRKP
jgi:hypothetical protein